MHRFKSIDDILNHQLILKKNRSEIDFKDIRSLEKPREVYLKTCLIIAGYFEQFGFRFLKSQVSLVKEVEKLKFTIRFQSDYNNIAGVYIGISAQLYIESRELKKWQEKHGVPGQNPSGDMFGGDFSMFSQSNNIQFLWNLADINEREIAIIEIMDLIENKVIQIFELFEDGELISEMIINGNFILRNPLINIQFLLFNKSEKTTSLAINNYLKSNKEIAERYKIDEAQIHKNGLPSVIPTYSHNLANFVQYYKLAEQIDL